jgi:hypothetical protein
MAYVKGQPFKPQFEMVTGTPLFGGSVEFYLWNTNTPTPFYTDSIGTSGGTSIDLDLWGTPDEVDIFYDTAITYKLVLKNQFGTVVDTLGPYSPPPTSVSFDAALIEIDQEPTGHFFANGGAKIQRFNDRVFIGGATENDGNSPTTAKDWLTEYYDANGYTLGYTLNATTVSLVGDEGYGGLMGGAHNFTSLVNGNYSVGVYGVAVNDNTTYWGGVNAFYGEAHQTGAVGGSAYGMELNTRTTLQSIDPRPHTFGDIVGLQLASGCGIGGVTFTGSITANVLTVASIIYALPYGGTNPNNYQLEVGTKLYGTGVTAGVTITSLGTGTGGVGTYGVSATPNIASRTLVGTDQFHASAAISIQPNPVGWKVGIKFHNTSIVGADGTSDGYGTAVAMAKGHQLQWFNSAGANTGSITSTNTVTTDATGIDFSPTGMAVNGHNKQVLALFPNVSSAVNYPQLGAAVTTGPVYLAATGNDANIDIQFIPKGTGTINFGTYTAGVVAQAGYITVKDSGGTLRRLLVG